MWLVVVVADEVGGREHPRLRRRGASKRWCLGGLRIVLVSLYVV
jgi:hypothetical protein